ncbi:MAG TPA: AMP-binding protein, partial [Acidimicrobiales bacterium]
TWAELLDRVGRLAVVLRDDLELAPGDHVASVLANRVEWFELALATLVTGVWLVPVNTHLQPEEVAYVLEDSGARVAFVDDLHRDAVAAATRAVPMVSVDGDLDARVAAAPARPIALDGPAGGRMHYTSGTTGRPKGVKRALPPTAGEYLAQLGRMGRAVGLDGSGPHLLTGPHYHAAVGGYALFDLVNGAPVVMMPRFDAARLLDLVAEHRIAHTHLVPTMMVRLLRLPDDVRARADTSSLTHVLHGAAPISPATKHAMLDWWGPVLTEYWGTSEAGTFTLISAAEWRARPGSVGRPLPGVEVVVVGEDGRPVPTGEPGTLYCRMGATAQPFRYHNDHEKTAAAYLEPGLFTMGDVGRVDEDGYVYLLDRATNMIISGGVNIYPAEVEAAMLAHPAVADVAVFGIPDEEWGEQVKAAVELVPGVAPTPDLAAELLAFARDRVAHYEAPRSIDFVDALPRLPSGKLRVEELKAPYWEGRARRI